MILQLFGLIDILSSLLFGLIFFGVYLKTITLILGIYLIIKGLVFLNALASIIDIAAGIILILSNFYAFPNSILAILGLLMLQKGIFSFF